MTHKEIYEKVAPGMCLFSVFCGKVLKAWYKMTEVHTNYSGDRTCYTVLESEGTHNVWVDHSANEWFKTKEEAVQWGIAQLEKRVNEWQTQITLLKKEK